MEQKSGCLTLNLVKARDAINNKKLTYACDFDKGVLQFMPEDAQGDTEACEELKNEFDYTGSGEDVF